MESDLVIFLRSAFTVLVFICFVAVTIWAYSGKRRKAFEEAANLPFSEDDTPADQESRQ